MDRKKQKLAPGKNDVQKECQDEKIAALERKLEHMENKLKLNNVQKECQDEKITALERKLEHMENKLKLNDVQKEYYEEKLTVLERKLEHMENKLKLVNESNDDALDINSLPNEIILNVFRYLEQNQLGQIARVCRRWNVLTKSPVLWRKVNVRIFSSDTEKNTVANSFINGLPSFVTFIKLDFSKCEGLDFEELCVKLHQNCPHVEELILFNLEMSYPLPEVINFCTQYLQCVKKLVFHNCYFPNHSRTVELNDNSKIEVLDLYCCEFSYFCNIQFSKLLYLRELRLADTYVDDTWFVDDASFFNKLYVLDLQWTSITATTFLAIQRHGHNLKELYLCYSDVGDHDLNFNKSVFPQLKTICLRCYGVTCEDVVSLIRSCPSLENVYVYEDVAESFAAHPFVLANRCKSGIVKAIDGEHDHNVDYLHN